MEKYLKLLDDSLPPEQHPRRAEWRAYALSGEQRAQEPLDNIERDQNLKDRILVDLGCGDGGFSVAAKHRGCHVISVDISLQALHRATARFEGRNTTIDVINASGLQMPLRSNTCDVVVLQDIIEHVPFPLTLLQESYRILKKGGVCFLSAVNAHYLPYIVADPHWGKPFVSMMPHSVGKLFICNLLKASPVYDVWELPTQQKIRHWLTIVGFQQEQGRLKNQILMEINEPIVSAIAVKPSATQKLDC